MAINEIDILLQRRDSDGNIEITYPLTTAENVAGLENKLTNYVNKLEKNQPGGYAGLDDAGRLPKGTLPEDAAETGDVLLKIDEKINIHNIDSQAHTELYNKIAAVETRLAELELLFNNGDRGFSVTFEDIEDVSVTGVWNRALKRMEF